MVEIDLRNHVDAQLATLFKDSDNGKVYTRTRANTTGLTKGIKVTTMMVGDIAVGLPAIPFEGRNAISIHNKSETITLYIGPSNVTADSVVGTTSGAEIGPNEFINFDITDNVKIYGRCPVGQEAMVKIMEIA